MYSILPTKNSRQDRRAWFGCGMWSHQSFQLLSFPMKNSSCHRLAGSTWLLRYAGENSDVHALKTMKTQVIDPLDVGERQVLPNVHGLFHLPETVSDLGPLWAHSCFPFESGNGELLKLFHGSQSVEKQVYPIYYQCTYT